MKMPTNPPPKADMLWVGQLFGLPITDKAHVCHVINRHRQYIVNTEHERRRRSAYMQEYWRKEHDRRNK